jgi:membrane dipeptidase
MSATAASSVRENKGFHPFLAEGEQPFLFIDSCMQAWPDADYANAHRHGVTTYAVTSWRPPTFSVEDALEGLMFWRLVARQYPNLSVVESVEDIHRAHREGKASFLLAAQDGSFIGNKLHRIEAFYRLGLRMMIPAYNRTNQICDGCADRTDSGLTSFGELVVDECNRVGLLLDCTHIGRRASLDIIERSSNPVVFSHSNAKALVDNPRNIDDEQIRACASRGGVIGLAPWGPIVMKPGTTTWPTLDDFIEHIDYVANLTGSSDHIAIGTDMSLGTYAHRPVDPWGEPAMRDIESHYGKHVTADTRSPLRAVNGFCSYPEVLNLIDGLHSRGYTDADIRKLLGENYLRVFEQVWV